MQCRDIDLSGEHFRILSFLLTDNSSSTSTVSNTKICIICTKYLITYRHIILSELIINNLGPTSFLSFLFVASEIVICVLSLC